jgi:hypothetical protein
VTAQAKRLRARRLLVTRSLVLAVVGVGSGVLAHLLAGGYLPSVLSVAASGLVATLVSLLLLRLGRRTGIALSVVAGQWSFHQAVSLGHPSQVIGHDHGQALALATESLATNSLATHSLVMSASMGAGHLLAAAVTALATVHADGVLRGFRQLLRVLSGWWVLAAERLFVDFLPPARMPRASWAPPALRHASMTGGPLGLRAPPPALIHP